MSTAIADSTTCNLPTYAKNDTAGQLQGLKEDGFALIPGVLSADEVNATKAEIDRLRPFGFDGCHPHIDHYKCVFNRDPFWVKYLDYPNIGELAEASMGANCHIIGMSAWRSRPGFNTHNPKNKFGVHSDNLMIEVDEELLVSNKVVIPITLCTAHYYLNDMTLDLCPTWVIRGSHKSGKWAQHVPEKEREEWRGNKIEPVLCKAGDVLFFRSEVWHSGSPNVSQDTRYLLQVHYSHRMIAQKFSPYTDFRFNHEVMAAATDRQKRFMGKHTQSAYD